MDPNCKPIHVYPYTVPRSVEQQLQQSKEIVRLVDIGVLEEDYSSEWASLSPSLAILMNGAEVYASRMLLMLAPVSASALSRCSLFLTMRITINLVDDFWVR
jgi:hypothetical protein